jgi:hypothetical protein
MASYVPGNVAIQGFSNVTLEAIELRVISNLLQQQSGNASQEDLKILRNDQAFDLGLPSPVPGN